MTAYRGYASQVTSLIHEIVETQETKIETAATWMADSIHAGGVVHLFGSGHSHMVAEEVFHRAGSLMPMNPMIDVNLTFLGTVNATLLERTSGYAETIIATHDIRQGEVVIVISNSGVNPVPIEAVLSARERGARTIAITADKHYHDAPSRHSSGRRLADVADLSLDTRTPKGDALVQLPGMEDRVGGASTVLGLFLINALVVETTARLADFGGDVPIIPTMNLPGGDDRMESLIKRYGDRLRLLKNA